LKGVIGTVDDALSVEVTVEAFKLRLLRVHCFSCCVLVLMSIIRIGEWILIDAFFRPRLFQSLPYGFDLDLISENDPFSFAFVDYVLCDLEFGFHSINAESKFFLQFIPNLINFINLYVLLQGYIFEIPNNTLNRPIPDNSLEDNKKHAFGKFQNIKLGKKIFFDQEAEEASKLFEV
jgi:hypothetical protein